MGQTHSSNQGRNLDLLFKTGLLLCLTGRIIDFTYLLLASKEKCWISKPFYIQIDRIVKWRGKCDRGAVGGCRSGFCEKTPGAASVSNRDNSSQLQVRSTAAQS